ncbi:MAG: hypothetical protein ACI9R3_006022 [Verrucomicrobiales bacterium]|jgi:hypothetical protein
MNMKLTSMNMKLTTLATIAGLTLAAGSAHAADYKVASDGSGDFFTIQDAIDSASVVAGDRILVAGPGNYAGAVVNKSVEIKGQGGAVINDGPDFPGLLKYGFQLVTEGSGATISHLTFEDVAFPVFSRYADSVTVTQCTMINPAVGIANWHGNEWQITHNKIEDLRTMPNGGGTGILTGSWDGSGASDNLIAHNTISGTLNLPEGELGVYSGAGIVVLTDLRYAGDAGGYVQYNRVLKNKISLVPQPDQDLVSVSAIILDDTNYPVFEDTDFVSNNKIGFNDLRGTDSQLRFNTPATEADNTISRNLGDNRGHGVHPQELLR